MIAREFIEASERSLSMALEERERQNNFNELKLFLTPHKQAQ